MRKGGGHKRVRLERPTALALDAIVRQTALVKVQMESIVNLFQIIGGIQMGQLEDLQSSVDALSGSVEQAKTRIMDDVTALEQHIADLENELAGKIDPAVLQPLKDQVDSLKSNVDAIDPVPPEPPPVEPPPEEPPPPPEG